MKAPFVYIMTNTHNTVLYTGVTSNLTKRVYEHKNKLIKGFASRYELNKLVYYEQHGAIIEAIEREKTIKSGSRAKKIILIESMNKEWRDLSEIF